MTIKKTFFFFQNDSGSEKIYNSHVILNADGDIVGNYSKLHLFDVETPEFKFRESKIVEKGRAILAPIPSPIGNIGVMIVMMIVDLEKVMD